MASLRAMTAPTAMVRRAGRALELPASELVTGDIVTLEAGARIAADGRLPRPTRCASTRTGTLTQNRMTTNVLKVAAGRQLLAAEPHGVAELREQPDLCRLLVAGALCNDTVVAGDRSLLGDPTETALVDAALRFGPCQARPRRSDRLGCTKGALDGLLARCVSISVDGSVVALDGDRCGRVLASADGLAADGVRVLGVAMRRWPGDATVLFTSIAFALGNRALVGAVALTVALQVALVSVPFARELLHLRALPAAHRVLVCAIAFAYLAAVEVDKMVARRTSAPAAE